MTDFRFRNSSSHFSKTVGPASGAGGSGVGNSGFGGSGTQGSGGGSGIGPSPPDPSSPSRPPRQADPPPEGSSIDDLARVFNTAIVATQSTMGRDSDFSGELFKVMESPPFRAILQAIRQHARLQGITDRQAAEQVIHAFRSIDHLWKCYLIQEGVDRLSSCE